MIRIHVNAATKHLRFYGHDLKLFSFYDICFHDLCLDEGVVNLNPLPLPEGVAPTSKDIIACLNDYLIQILQVTSHFVFL